MLVELDQLEVGAQYRYEQLHEFGLSQDRRRNGVVALPEHLDELRLRQGVQRGLVARQLRCAARRDQQLRWPHLTASPQLTRELERQQCAHTVAKTSKGP